MATFILIFLASPIGIGIFLLLFWVFERRKPGVSLPQDRNNDDTNEGDGGWYAWNDVEPDLPPDSGQRIGPEEVEEAIRRQKVRT